MLIKMRGDHRVEGSNSYGCVFKVIYKVNIEKGKKNIFQHIQYNFEKGKKKN